MSELGGGGKQLGSLARGWRAGASGEMEHRKREHRLAVAALGGKPVPFGGLLVVARDAEAVGIKLAEQRHRLDVALAPRPGASRWRRR